MVVLGAEASLGADALPHMRRSFTALQTREPDESAARTYGALRILLP